MYQVQWQLEAQHKAKELTAAYIAVSDNLGNNNGDDGNNRKRGNNGKSNRGGEHQRGESRAGEGKR